MQKPVVTKAIVLTRVNYGEADRILTFITPHHGKISVIAKGVRKSKSKLAGGIELFSVSDITYIIGRSEINTLISTRLDKYFDNIVKDISRTNTGYEIIKTIHKATEDAAEEAYFRLLLRSFESLDDFALDPKVVSLWFNMQLLKLTGHTPNLKEDTASQRLDASKKYNFHFDEMKFSETRGDAGFDARFIKFLRLGFQAASPKVLSKVEKGQKITALAHPLVLSMLKNYVRI